MSNETNEVVYGNWKLFHKGTDKVVLKGTVMKDRHGEDNTITGGKPPHKPSSSGFVWVEEHGYAREYYPTVFDMEWREVA